MFVCNVVLFYHVINKSNEKKDTNLLLNVIEDSQIHMSYMLYESLDYSLMGMKFKRGLDDFSEIENLDEQPRLVFRYNLLMCPPCIQDVIHSIEAVFPDYKTNENIIFSCEGLEKRFDLSFNGKVNYAFMDDSLFIPIKKYQAPYMYILDKELKLKFLFVPSKGSNQKTIDYLMLVKNKYSI